MTISTDIPFIDSNYHFLVESIRRLESGKISLADSVQIVQDVRAKLERVTCGIGEKLLARFDAIFRNNPGWINIQKINNLLSNRQNDDGLPDKINPMNIVYYKMCILVSVDCERTFSRYKNILRDNRRSFLFDNLRKYLIINCNRNMT